MTSNEDNATASTFGKTLALADNDHHDDALAAFARALEIEPGQAQIYVRRAAVWQNKGEMRHALADCDAAIGLDPGHAAYYVPTMKPPPGCGLIGRNRTRTAAGL